MSLSRLATQSSSRFGAPEEKPAGTVEFLQPGIDHATLKTLSEVEHSAVVCGKLRPSMLERVDVSKVTGETVAYRGILAYDPVSKRTERQSWRFKVKDGKAVIDETFPVKIFI